MQCLSCRCRVTYFSDTFQLALGIPQAGYPSFSLTIVHVGLLVGSQGGSRRCGPTAGTGVCKAGWSRGERCNLWHPPSTIPRTTDPHSPSGMKPSTPPIPRDQRTTNMASGWEGRCPPSNQRCEFEKGLEMKLLRERIKSHPIINPVLCLIGCREPWVGTSARPRSLTTCLRWS